MKHTNESPNSEKVRGDRVLERVDANQQSIDPNVVDWEGPGDPYNPLNWSSTRKILIIIFVSSYTFTSNLAATIFAPGVKQMAQEFHITNPTIEYMLLSIYVLGFALGPIIFGPLSELYGRLVIYYTCSLVFLAFTVGCTFSTNVEMFLAFRFICGCAASGPMSIGGGTLADIIPQEERGRAISIFTSGPALAPILGPVIGGYVYQYADWRWTLGVILMLAGIISIGTFLFLRETYAPTILHMKAKRMREETGNPNLRPKSVKRGPPHQLILQAITRPMKLLIFSPMVLLLALYSGFVFGFFFLLFATFPFVFQDIYGFSSGTSGLAYLGLGTGTVVGLVVFSVVSDRVLGKEPGESMAKPEQRLIPMKWFGIVTPIGCFIYGWGAHYHAHWTIPMLGTALMGFSSLFITIPAQIYCVDAFGPQAAASALAANLIIRSLFGAFLDLAASPLYEKLGLGWGNSVLGFIILAFTPVPWLFYRYGEYLRTRFAVEL
ncbi:polyamine transporter 4 [Nannizzia gypsea CBS 118893]|uniref:Polyamine transporter 4 n=1 Tax=Arthroderma gypseum (strain ATCC MYA-4604 / CBS 118893) TaxID=535722 RepID=E4UVW1_ARTGP|nr:polyamine transporter 4 [Nannizzia gypsea CBS 118893]EFR02438.1 polyamine transporter 4 [Nannizzia gypsea CBS 118893]